MFVFRYEYTNIEIQQDEKNIEVRKNGKVDNAVLAVVYFFIYLSFLLLTTYLIVNATSKEPISYGETIFLKIIAFVLINLNITCFFSWGAWILFSKHNLAIDALKLTYQLTVIFPIIRHRISVLEITSASVTENKYGFGIIFSTLARPIYSFHFPRYKRTQDRAKDKSFYKNEIDELNLIVQSVNSFIKSQKNAAGCKKQICNPMQNRWECDFSDKCKRFIRFGKISVTSIFSTGAAFLLAFCVVALFLPIAFHPCSSSEDIVLFIIGARLGVILFIPMCISSLISFFAMLVHPFTKVTICISTDMLVFSRAIFWVNIEKRWRWKNIGFIKVSHKKKQSIVDFIRNPEGSSKLSNYPLPIYYTQFFDTKGELLGQISDLFSDEAVFVQKICQSVSACPCPEDL